LKFDELLVEPLDIPIENITPCQPGTNSFWH
jgi:hypothetical protein